MLNRKHLEYIWEFLNRKSFSWVIFFSLLTPVLFSEELTKGQNWVCDQSATCCLKVTKNWVTKATLSLNLPSACCLLLTQNQPRRRAAVDEQEGVEYIAARAVQTKKCFNSGQKWSCPKCVCYQTHPWICTSICSVPFCLCRAQDSLRQSGLATPTHRLFRKSPKKTSVSPSCFRQSGHWCGEGEGWQSFFSEMSFAN